MSQRRIISIVFLLAVVVPSALSLFSGCDSKPDAPEFNNPFDPEGTDSGDPFNLFAIASDTVITLYWDQISGYDLATYQVMHTQDVLGDFFSVGAVAATDQSTLLFNYPDPQPTAVHYFKIQAYDTQGNFTLLSHIVPTSATTLASVLVNDGSRQVASRNIILGISVSAGDSLRISQTGLPDSEMVLAADDSGTPVVLPWDLGPADSNDTTLVLNVVVQNGTVFGDTNKVVLDVNFEPEFILSGGGTQVATRNPVLELGSEGLAYMRFASSEEDLADLPWLLGAETYSGYQLENTANTQTIFGEFMGDFGFSVSNELDVTPDLLTDAGFYLALPEDHISDQINIRGICNANATLMRFSESLDFGSVPWAAYADTVVITLTPEPGQKTIYGQFRNDFADSPILTDYVIYVSQSLEVTIVAPVDGSLLQGGTSLRVQGTTTASSGTAPVDSVSFDGGSGFMAATGTNNWYATWDIPHFDTDTEVVIRARAWAGDDSTTTLANVTITQLVVAITSPIDGAELPGGTEVVIAGFANPHLGGAPIDSVTVTIDDNTSLAQGTDSWTFNWQPAAVTESVEKTITAIGYSATERNRHVITISVIP